MGVRNSMTLDNCMASKCKKNTIYIMCTADGLVPAGTHIYSYAVDDMFWVGLTDEHNPVRA